MKSLNILIYNAKGLNHVIKQKKILTQLKEMDCDIALLQETHLSDKEHKKLKQEWVGQTFFSSHSSTKIIGVCIRASPLFLNFLPEWRAQSKLPVAQALKPGYAYNWYHWKENT